MADDLEQELWKDGDPYLNVYPDPQTHYEKQLLERFNQYKDYSIELKLFGELITEFTLADIIHLTKLIGNQ